MPNLSSFFFKQKCPQSINATSQNTCSNLQALRTRYLQPSRNPLKYSYPSSKRDFIDHIITLLETPKFSSNLNHDQVNKFIEDTKNEWLKKHPEKAKALSDKTFPDGLISAIQKDVITKRKLSMSCL